jgi:hypothetical protein
MSDQIKMSLIIGSAIIVATGIWIYFSPFQICVRGWTSFYASNNKDWDEENIRLTAIGTCMKRMAGNSN